MLRGLALVAFVLIVFDVHTRVALLALGLALWVASTLVTERGK